MAEILFYRLIVTVDDFGRFYANPSIVKNRCFQLKADDFTSEQMTEWLGELSKAGLIEIYQAEDGRKYLSFKNWAKHQSTRAKTSKFPAPSSVCKQMQASESKCLQMSPYSYSYSYSEIENDKDAKADESDDGFEAFWNLYPRKSGDIKQACFEYLGVIQSGVSKETILDAVKWQAAEKDVRYMPSAERWLRNKGWTESRPTPKEDRGKPFQYESVSAADYDFEALLCKTNTERE